LRFLIFIDVNPITKVTSNTVRGSVNNDNLDRLVRLCADAVKRINEKRIAESRNDNGNS